MSGGGSGEYSQSKDRTKTNFSENVWGTQGSALSNLYDQAQNLFSSMSPRMTGAIPGVSDYINRVSEASMPSWQNQLSGGAYSDMGLQNSLMNSLNDSLNNPTATQEINSMIMGGSGNNYADAMRNQYVSDANRATENMLSNLDARAAASGMSGGSRHGVATARGMDDINRNLQRNLADVGYSTFDKDLDRKLAIAQKADEGTLSRQRMLQDMLGNKQDAMTGGLGFGQDMQALAQGAFSPFMAPWQMAGAYANLLGDPTVLGSGSSTSRSKSKGSATSGYGGAGASGGKGGSA